MASLRVLHSILITLLLLPPRAIAQGKLALFLDPECTTPSKILPTVLLPLSTCLIPEDVYGIVIESYPECPGSGTASMIMYKDTICAQQTAGFVQNNCYWYFASFTVPGVMFTCDEAANDPQPTSTTTVTASRIAGIATNSAGGSQATDGSVASTSSTSTTIGESSSLTSGSTGSSDSSSPTSGITGSSDSSSPTSGSTGSSDSSSGSASSTGSSGLGSSDRIAIGVGLGVGIPSVLIALLAWLLPRH